MDEIDVNVGYWVQDQVYIVTRIEGHEEEEADHKNTKRVYNVSFPQMEILSNCPSWAHHYFRYTPGEIVRYKPKNRHLYTDKFVKYMNGRAYYQFLNPSPKFVISKPIKMNERDDLLFALEPYVNIKYDLSSLICTLLSTSSGQKWDKILDIMKKCPHVSACDPCTIVGRNISKSLIKISALRIFASPEQSIIELPVNSIDAYNPDKRVGKFGMGFFSILYWLIGHPKRFMTIHSFYKKDGRYGSYSIVMREGNNTADLEFSLKVYPFSEVTKTGFRVEIDASQDPFDNNTTANFSEQMHKLDFVTSANLYESSPKDGGIYSMINSKSVVNSSSSKDIVFVIEKDILLTEDFATGVPLDVLLGVSFIPSLSTKTISSSIMGSGTYVNRSRLTGLVVKYGPKPKKLLILVNDICVVSIGDSKKSSHVFILDLPANTKIPVSRDDIIMSPETAAEIKKGIDILFSESALKYRSVSKLQKLLQKYIDYTANIENKNIVSSAMSDYFEANKRYLIPKKHKAIYKNISDGSDIHFISSTRYDVTSIERQLEDNIESDSEIWFAMRVIYIDIPGIRVTLASLVNYIFIDSEYKKTLGDGWIQTITGSFFDVKLYPYIKPVILNVTQKRVPKKISKDGFARYDIMIDQSQDRLKKFLGKGSNLYPKIVDMEPRIKQFTYSALARYESLDIYFSMSAYNLDSMVDNLVYLSIILSENDYITIVLEMIRKFSEFKGNQTYGGSKHILVIGAHKHDISALITGDYPFKGDEKRIKIMMEHMINCIKAVKERSETRFLVISDNNPEFIYKYSSANKIFYEAAMKNTTSLKDFTILMAGLGRGFLTKTNIDPILVDEYVGENISRIHNHSNVSLHDLYETWENELYSSAQTTYSFLLKYKDEAKRWVENFSSATSSIKIHVSSSEGMPSDGDRSFKLGTLMNYIFKNPLPIGAKDEIKEFNNFVTNISKLPDYQTPLQIVEIAINEGTTKPFIEAVLTELSQNSIDAIRSSIFKGAGKVEINVEKSKDSKTVYLKISDPIGMDMKAFLYIGIPFLSTKTPSEMVTGEMGSGFFNVYRESSAVTIDTTGVDGIRKISRDIPIKDKNGRVIDVKKTMTVSRKFKGKTNDQTGTTITLEIPVKNDFEYARLVGKISYIVKNVLGMALSWPFFNFSIYFNSVEVSIPKVLCGKIGHFEIYATNISLANFKEEEKAIENTESYLLTKGIPFAPLGPYIKDIFSSESPDGIQNNIVVNITHGGYTPVQTRTKINMSKDTEADFLKMAHYALFVSLVRYCTKGRNADRLLDHYESTKSANQLKFQPYRMSYIKGHSESNILRYTSFFGQPSVVDMINKCIDLLAGDTYKNKKKVIDSMLSKYSSGYTLVDEMVRMLIKGWLEPKNTEKVMTYVDNVGEEIIITEEEASKEPDQPEPEIELLIRRWINAYCAIAKEKSILGYSVPHPKTKVVYSLKNMKLLGWFEKETNTIVINTYTWYVDDDANNYRLQMLRFLKSVPVDIDATLKNNKLWQSTFAYSFPAATLPHELEHFRRKDEHSGGHDSMVVKLYSGDNIEDVPKRSFDQVSNAVYQYVLGYGFWKRYKDS